MCRSYVGEMLIQHRSAAINHFPGAIHAQNYCVYVHLDAVISGKKQRVLDDFHGRFTISPCPILILVPHFYCHATVPISTSHDRFPENSRACTTTTCIKLRHLHHPELRPTPQFRLSKNPDQSDWLNHSHVRFKPSSTPTCGSKPRSVRAFSLLQ